MLRCLTMRFMPPLLCLLLAACGKPAPEAPAPLPVEVAMVGNGTAAQGAAYPARIAYDRETVLSPRLGGIVRAMPVSVGQRLGRGALIAALDDTPYRAALSRADADASRTARDAARDAALVSAGATAETDAKDAASAAQAARAARQAAAYDLASARLTMPFPGIVLAKSADIGATVAPGQPVASVADTASPLIARVSAPANAARNLQRGAPATISVDGQTITGHVLRIGAASDAASGTVEVDVALDAGHGLTSGAAGSAQFATAMADGEQHIPAEALVDSQNGTGHVYLVTAGVARLTALRVLGMGDSDVRVAGLPLGAKVITAGAGFVADGQRVTVLAK